MKTLLVLLTLLRVAFVGDPQVDNATQLGYARASIYRELRERGDLDLVVILGDLVNDKMELLGPTVSSLDSLGCPWLAVPGNHDRDRYPDDPDRARDLTTWQRTLGYVDTSFVLKGVRFILMNDVRTRGKADYEAGWSEDQKRWLAGVLAGTPAGQQVVLATHIPLEEMHAQDTLAALLAGKERILLVSGHTHQVRRETLRIGGQPVESLTAGAACGSWWRGIKDADGVPDALMNCGAPRGYFVCDFSCRSYALSFKKVAGTETLSLGRTPEGRLAVNVFGGSRDGTVKLRSGGRTVLLERVQAAAPEVLARIESNHAMTREYRREHKEEFIPLRKLASPHVWAAPESFQPNPGDRVTVLYRDRRMKCRRTVKAD